MALAELLHVQPLLKHGDVLLELCNLLNHVVHSLPLNGILHHVALAFLQLTNLLVFLGDRLVHALVSASQLVDLFLLLKDGLLELKLLLSLLLGPAHDLSDHSLHHVAPSEGSLKAEACLTPSIQVLDELFVAPHDTECLLNLDGGLLAHSKVVHEHLATALKAEPLLDANDDGLKLLSILHEVVSPSLPLDVFKDHLLNLSSSI